MELNHILGPIFSQTFSLFHYKRKDKFSLDSSCITNTFEETTKFLEHYIIQIMKVENEISLDEKIQFTNYIVFNRCYLKNLSDFYEEECHLSLLNWLWNERQLIKENTNTKLLELLYNILIIFEILPIKPQDLIGLKLFEKFNKIKGYVCKTHPDIFLRIQNLLNYWKHQYENVTEKSFLRKKHLRANDTDTDAESEESNSFSLKKKKITSEKRKKTVNFNLNYNKVLFFDKDEEPIQILKEKNKYDPLKFI